MRSKKDEIPRGWFSDYSDDDILFIDGSRIERNQSRKTKKISRNQVFYSDISSGDRKKGKNKKFHSGY